MVNEAIALTEEAVKLANNGEHDSAIGLLGKALGIDPSLAEGYYNRSVCLRMKCDLEGALADCSKAIELKPEFAEAYEHRAIIYHLKGDEKNKNADIAKAREIGQMQIARAFPECFTPEGFHQLLFPEQYHDNDW